MRSFIINCLIFGLPLIILLIVTGFLADGNTDPYYLRVTSPLQHSLIIGTSRSANGLHPDVLNDILKQEYKDINLYNFSFTLNDSPFGKVYFEAIKKKLALNAKKGVFIISVDPWSIANRENERDDVSQFRENNGCLSKIESVSLNPNFPYLINNYDEPYLTIMIKRIKADIFGIRAQKYVHNNGWMEASFPMDYISRNKNLQMSVSIYKKNIPLFRLSEIRKAYLIKTIILLKEYGDVYLVRLPVHPQISILDNKMYPHFDSFIDSVSKKHHVPYINFTNSCDKYTYRDGVHIDKSSGVLFSKDLALSIIKYVHVMKN